MWDKEVFAKAIGSSTSFREAARKLGVGSHTHVARIVRSMGIDTSHFEFGRRYQATVGKTYNRLTINEVFKKSATKWFCRCTCQCGQTDVVTRLDGVLSGRVLSCGCASRNRPTMLGAKNPAFKGCGELGAVRMRNIKQGAARRGIEFCVSKEYLWALFESQDRVCKLSGVCLSFGRTHFSHETTASLDRIDSTKGYIEGNVQWVHKDVNKIKRDLDQAYFLDLCDRISAHSHRQ